MSFRLRRSLDRSSRAVLCAALLIAASCSGQVQGAQKDRLKVFFVDVEGGQATLFVTPEGHSLLIDTGWPGNNGRDAERIAAAAQIAGLKRLDYVLLTHYHDDHVGGVPQLVARLPVGTFIDHGPNRELDHGVTQHGYDEYQKVLAKGTSQHILARAGDTLPIPGMSVRVISADGQVLQRAIAGAAQKNPFCSATEARPPDQTENARSLGVEITFGRLKLLDLGDLTWDKEMQLMCPDNKLGTADVYIVSHHGWYQSSSPALVHALHPRVAIMDNGEKKGGSSPTLATLHGSPGLEAMWQLHYSAEGGPQGNATPQYIANLQGSDPGHFLELSGAKDGSFDVLNSRTNAVTKYGPPAR